MTNTDISQSRFPKGRPEEVSTLRLGTYVVLVDKEVILKQELLGNTVIGVLQTKTVSASRRAVPQVALP